MSKRDNSGALAMARTAGSGGLVPRKFDAPVQHTSFVRESTRDAR